MALSKNIKAFVMHIASFILKIIIYPVQKTPIVLFITKEVTTLAEDAYFVNIFLKDLAKILLKKTDLNKYTFKFLYSK